MYNIPHLCTVDCSTTRIHPSDHIYRPAANNLFRNGNDARTNNWAFRSTRQTDKRSALSLPAFAPLVENCRLFLFSDCARSGLLFRYLCGCDPATRPFYGIRRPCGPWDREKWSQLGFFWSLDETAASSFLILGETSMSLPSLTSAKNWGEHRPSYN